MILKRALVNFAMIQSVILASSVSFSTQLPFDNHVEAVFFLTVVGSALSLAPAIIMSLIFAYLSK